MSMEYEEIITCPKCGNKSSFTIWRSLNTTLNPEEKEQLITGELFRFVCPECGYRSLVDYGFLYHQMEDHMMIYYVQDDESYENAYEIFTGKNTKGEELEVKVFDAFGDGMGDYLYRIVKSQNSLREKIRIFDDGKDDRIIEIMKLLIASNIQKQHEEITDFKLFYDGSPDSNDFAIVTPEGASLHASVPEGAYEDLQESFSGKLPDMRDKEDLLIDADWAMRFISQED